MGIIRFAEAFPDEEIVSTLPLTIDMVALPRNRLPKRAFSKRVLR
jgi:hypothetical protein